MSWATKWRIGPLFCVCERWRKHKRFVCKIKRIHFGCFTFAPSPVHLNWSLCFLFRWTHRSEFTFLSLRCAWSAGRNTDLLCLEMVIILDMCHSLVKTNITLPDCKLQHLFHRLSVISLCSIFIYYPQLNSDLKHLQYLSVTFASDPCQRVKIRHHSLFNVFLQLQKYFLGEMGLFALCHMRRLLPLSRLSIKLQMVSLA